MRRNDSVNCDRCSPQTTNCVTTNNDSQWQRPMVTTNIDIDKRSPQAKTATNDHYKQWLLDDSDQWSPQSMTVRWQWPMVTTVNDWQWSSQILTMITIDNLTVDNVSTQWQHREANTKNDSHWQLLTVITNNWMTATGGHHV